VGGTDDGIAASRFEAADLTRLDATVLLASRSFVRLELALPWAQTTIPLRDSGLSNGELVAVAGHPDPELDQSRPPSPGEPVQTFPGFRVQVVKTVGPRHLAVEWPEAEAPAQPVGTVAADEDDWSDV
jgi:hypothetical protein